MIERYINSSFQNSPYDIKDVQQATAGAYLTYDPGSAAMAAMYPYANR